MKALDEIASGWSEVAGFIAISCLIALGIGSIAIVLWLFFTVVAFPTELAAPASQWLPTPGWTTGVATKATAAQLCAKGYTTKSVRPPEDYTEALKKKQLGEPRYTDHNPKHYEEDHLISLEIGGDPSDPRNLWPEPYNGKCGAHVKDKLENKLHDLVCAGKITLAQAQAEISSDWIKSYNAHVGRLQCQ